MIGKDAEGVLNRAIRYAVELGQEFFTLEHVLWSLLKDESTQACIRSCGGDPDNIRLELEQYIAKEVPKLSPPQRATESELPPGPIATLSIQRLVQRALFQVQSSGREEVTPEDLLVALFQAKDSHAVFLLQKAGIERLDVLHYVSHGSVEGAPAHVQQEGERGGGGPASENSFQSFAHSLNERAKLGKIDPLIGRDAELERMIQTLCRRRKNNPLLVGEAGVGKTALAEGLALRIVDGKVPDLLARSVVYSLDLGSLTAGTRYRGDFEARIKKVIEGVQKKKKDGEDPILFIDEMHQLVGAGAVGGGSMDAANLLKPLLSSGEIRCIGSTTYNEYRSHIEKDSALARRFQKIDLTEPSQEETIAILQGLKSKFEAHHRVTYAQEALRAAVELSVKHLTDRFLPDKAIDVLDEAGARLRLKRPGGSDVPVTVDLALIEEVIAQIARIPAKNVTGSQKQRLQSLERDLRLTLFGQDQAIDAVVTAIRLARSGLRTGEKPIGSFLFCGPTGVGKTELSKQLASSLGVPFLRFDMSEYGEKHTVSRLIGAPPGYVGFEQAGLLTEAMTKNPHSVVLLDEIEKAHPDIWNILLQVMDHGRLTDNNGRKADFRNCILILTSNVGSREMERRPLGMGAATADTESQAARGAAKTAVERAFTPEFRNRLDAILFFNPLSPEVVGQVVMKQLVELETQLLAKNVEVEFTDALKGYLVEKGYDRVLGARPLARLIQDEVKKPLANEILFGKLEHGGRALVDCKDGKVVLEFKKPRPRKRAAVSAGESEPVS